MEKDRAIALVKMLAADPALRERLTSATESNRLAILTELGYADVTPADVLASASLWVPQAVEEIDDEQLASVAGGGITGDNPTIITTTTVTVGAAAAAAT
ncbi:Nif11-like leader peptide family natural product precursor [Nakamurella sp. PAMC28650]|uniref:Nif11-like leader peptide family natural product precursor n=1 Tax=Nakamurella sp. PAMC28650 TaxID=2762325 RepID=UPI00164D57F2|nr:Nif11-like leader peptide family natural product precursor [Nakamurella sp. PAMC28650]QNK82118.1 hypothetical protein H7F38_05015 [Nakamurella sp. PAMC28650]